MIKIDTTKIDTVKSSVHKIIKVVIDRTKTCVNETDATRMGMQGLVQRQLVQLTLIGAINTNMNEIGKTVISKTVIGTAATGVACLFSQALTHKHLS